MPDPNVSQAYQQQGQAPCRSCIDFKTWAKQQREVLSNKSWDQKIVRFKSNEERVQNCPVDKEELGRSTWKLLHTMAANFPDIPTTEEMTNMKSFFSVFSKVYPCDYCAKDFQNELKQEPIDVTNQRNFSQWLCRIHNRVNLKLGKAEFDCSKTNERWRDGWKDGSCDYEV